MIEVGAGKSAIRWRVNGGSTNTASFSTKDDTLGALNLSAGLDVATTRRVRRCPVLEKLIPYVPGRAPSDGESASENPTLPRCSSQRVALLRLLLRDQCALSASLSKTALI